MQDAVLSILVLGGIALLVGAFVLWRKGGARRQIVLMVLAALVVFLNVAIWTVPSSDGTAPIDKVRD